MRVLGSIFPDVKKYRVVDIYCKRRAITRHNVRLRGTQPYDDDEQKPLHHAHAKAQVEHTPGSWVIVAGLPAKDFFEEAFGKINENGGMMLVGDRMVSRRASPYTQIS